MGTVTITKEEFDTVIETIASEYAVTWEYAEEDRSGEYIYYVKSDEFPNNIVVRVCSSINTYNDISRGTGEDSIKVMLWNVEHDKPAAGREYTKRIESWKSNLKPKLRNCIEDWNEMVTMCSNCSIPLIIRSGKFGKFLGCSNYPDCEEKHSI